MTDAVRVADASDVRAIARLLHDFNLEYDEPTPGPEALARRIEQLLAEGNTVVLLAGEGPDGLAVLRFRLSIWTEGLECYLAELYVTPDRRGHGLGKALMNAALELSRQRGADYMDLNSGETDAAARRLYESLGFSRTGHKPVGPVNFYYEREL